VLSVDASWHPGFRTAIYGGAVGVGFATRMGSLPLFGHAEVLAGLAAVAGVQTHSSLDLQISIGLDYLVGEHVGLGIHGKFHNLSGDDAGGSGSFGAWSAHAAYRF
jgi:hypothetical protein